MPIRFRCPSCQRILQIATRKAGTDVVCPRCETSTVVPSSSCLITTWDTRENEQENPQDFDTSLTALHKLDQPLSLIKPELNESLYNLAENGKAVDPLEAQSSETTSDDRSLEPVVLLGPASQAVLLALTLGIMSLAFVTGYQLNQ